LPAHYRESARSVNRDARTTRARAFPGIAGGVRSAVVIGRQAASGRLDYTPEGWSRLILLRTGVADERWMEAKEGRRPQE
jgi:hypothetical protein